MAHVIIRLQVEKYQQNEEEERKKKTKVKLNYIHKHTRPQSQTYSVNVKFSGLMCVGWAVVTRCYTLRHINICGIKFST